MPDFYRCKPRANGEKWGAPILSGMEVLAYNTDYVSPEEAETWDTLFSEEEHRPGEKKAFRTSRIH